MLFWWALRLSRVFCLFQFVVFGSSTINHAVTHKSLTSVIYSPWQSWVCFTFVIIRSVCTPFLFPSLENFICISARGEIIILNKKTAILRLYEDVGKWQPFIYYLLSTHFSITKSSGGDQLSQFIKSSNTNRKYYSQMWPEISAGSMFTQAFMVWQHTNISLGF